MCLTSKKPSKFSKDDLLKDIQSLQFFFHRIHLIPLQLENKGAYRLPLANEIFESFVLISCTVIKKKEGKHI